LSISIEQAKIDDLETLYKIERECFTIEAFTEEQISYLLKIPNSISLTAWIGKEIGGFIIGLLNEYNKIRTGHIYTIDVARKHRRKGVGLRLLEELERIFIEKGVELCYLEARLDNAAARKLYRKQGYVEVQRLKEFYSKGTHGIRLVKKLS